MRARWAALATLTVLGACKDEPPLRRSSFGHGGGDVTPHTPTGAGGGGGSDEQIIDDPDAPCDVGITVDTADPFDGAAAMGLCKRAADDADWGVIDARWAMADGSSPSTADAFDLGHGVVDDFGARVDPREGARMLALSSGTAREPGDPDFASPEGFDKGYTSEPPDGYPKESPACNGVITGGPHDDAALEVIMRAPPGAQALAYDFDFFTYEWPDYVCSIYNDFFVALLDPPPSGQPDANISFDQLGNSVSVNNALVRVCECFGSSPCMAPPQAPQVEYECGEGPGQLDNTGFENRAATGWLVTRAPVASGEVLELRFAVYDSGDGILDSTVVVDNFRWLGEAEDDPVTHPVE